MREVFLDGSSLNEEEMYAVVFENCPVFIRDDAKERVEKAHNVLKNIEKTGKSIYGLNKGVGWNKDKNVYAERYEAYNRNLLRSHMIGVGEGCSQQEVRMTMLLRLNKFLKGRTGVSLEIVTRYQTFLNQQVTPVLFSRGSVGEADIGILSGIGLVMIGEGEAWYQGEKISGEEVLKRLHLSKLILGPKDGLGMVSSNAYAAALAVLALQKTERYFSVCDKILCLSMEALGGVMDPFKEDVNGIREYAGQIKTASLCRTYLEGSYLQQTDRQKALQDPLSFRSYCAVMGAVRDAFAYTKKQVLIECNTSDDNPSVMFERNEITGSSNFEPLSWVLGMEMLAVALGHLSKTAINRMVHLSDPGFTGLTRFLTPKEGAVIAFGTIQKTISALDAEIRLLIQPVSLDFLCMAGQIEDHSSNSVLTVQKMDAIIDNLITISAIELMHGAQAVDLRGEKQLGQVTKELYFNYRKVVPKLEEDRALSSDIEKSREFILKEMKKYEKATDF